MTEETSGLLEFEGLLRIIKVFNLDRDLFNATCTLVDSAGNILDRLGLYYLKSSHSLMGQFVEEGQIWEVSGVRWIGKLITESNYTRPTNTVEPQFATILRPSGKHLIWHLTHSKWYPGIGKQKATSLIDSFGNDGGFDALYRALDEENVSALAATPLITQWDAEAIIQGWKRHGSTNALRWFDDKGIDPVIARKVFEFHGAKTVEAIEEDPYRLTSFNMPWGEVDKLARDVFGINSNDNRRIEAAVTECLWSEFHDGGHTKIPVNTFVVKIGLLLGGDLEEMIAARLGMIDQSRGLLRGNYIHQFETAVMEMVVAQRIADLMDLDYFPPLTEQEMSSVVARFELENGFNLTIEQKKAIAASVKSPFSIITGGAGVGKTTVLKALYALYDAVGVNRKQLALSGRAAQRMSEATLEDASTIAGYIYNYDWKSVPIEEQAKTVLVIDEASMIDIHSLYRLIDKTPPCVHIILIGDPFQLPPVGGGLVLHELIDREYLPISELSIVKRQGTNSSIPSVANDFRNGHVPLDYGDNVEAYDIHKTILSDKVLEEYRKEKNNTQILCATNKLVREINAKAQEMINHDSLEIKYRIEGLVYRAGIRLHDPVICNANLYNEKYDLRNGTLGRIIDVYTPPKSFGMKKSKNSKNEVLVESYGRVRWDDGSKHGYITELPLEVIEHIELAYAITVHKSQGSQFNRVIFAAVSSSNIDRTLVYTAVTRASKHLVIIGDMKAVEKAILLPPAASKRHVGLGDFLDETFA